MRSEWDVFANDCVNLRLVEEASEMSDIASPPPLSFHPDLTHQVFDDERILGFKKPVIDMYYAADTLYSYMAFEVCFKCVCGLVCVNVCVSVCICVCCVCVCVCIYCALTHEYERVYACTSTCHIVIVSCGYLALFLYCSVVLLLFCVLYFVSAVRFNALSSQLTHSHALSHLYRTTFGCSTRN
jgi:Histone acetyl transferase HAT1 N-terminus